MAGKNPQNRPYALQENAGWVYRYGVDFVIKVGEIQEGHGAAFLEYVNRQGEEPPAHTHDTEDEMFYVVEGALTFQCGGESFDLQKGAFIFLPHGFQHTYLIRSQAPVRLIVVTAPVREGQSGGWGGFVSDLEASQGQLIAEPRIKSDDINQTNGSQITSLGAE
jgi:quercetin dioxygenase-like cupin family protein